MRPFTRTIPFDDALGGILAAARPLARTERIPVESADGRVLAAAIVAGIDVPAFDRAAMDGYAVIAAGTSGATADHPIRLGLAGHVAAGGVAGGPVTAGTCQEVATGAPLPLGADAVVMVEHTGRDGDDILIERPATPRQHVGRRGGDIQTGETLLPERSVLTPAGIGAVTAIGQAHVDVFARPRVAVLCTGDEVVSPGRPLGPGQVYNVNRYTLEALIRRHGGEPVIVPTTGDSLAALEHSVDAAAGCDLIVSSGGSSVGEHDLVIDVLRARGEVIFHGVAIKPGMPTVFGRLGRTLWLGLSGYPASCLSNAYVMLVPLLRTTARLPDWQPRTVTATLTRRLTSPAGRLQFYQVRLDGDTAEPAFKGSGDITSMARADGYVVIPPHVQAIEADTVVSVTLYQ